MRDKEVALDVTDLLDAKPQIVSGIPEESLTLLNSNSFSSIQKCTQRTTSTNFAPGNRHPQT